MSEPTEPPAQPLLAYRVSETSLPLVPAGVHREWMTQTAQQFATRCLPLLLANQAGWHVLNDVPVTIEWDGGAQVDSLRISYEGTPSPLPPISLFGYGILTWHAGYIFRTPPGFNLLVRGPANLPKDGIQALEGLVETDWSSASFTVNWQLTRPGHPVTFGAGEPVALLVPQRRQELARFRPQVLDMAEAPEIAKGFQRWSDSRQAFIHAQRAGLVRPTEWQKDYFRGRLPGGETPIVHEVRLNLQPFEE